MDILSLGLIARLKKSSSGESGEVLERLIAHENNDLAHVSSDENESWNNKVTMSVENDAFVFTK